MMRDAIQDRFQSPDTDFTSAGLIAHLAQLGMPDNELARVMALMNARHRDTQLAEIYGEDLLEKRSGEGRRARSAAPGRGVKSAAPAPKAKVTVFLSEEQEILRGAFQEHFWDHPNLQVVGSSGRTDVNALVKAVLRLRPRVVVLGVTKVDRSTVEALEALRKDCPDTNVVLLFAYNDGGGMATLREVAAEGHRGCAYLMKHSVDTAEQLAGIICAVADGQVMVDPTVMEGLLSAGDRSSSHLQELSPRDLEILGWVAKGYRNNTIADLLSRDVKTIERHLNNIYSKL